MEKFGVPRLPAKIPPVTVSWPQLSKLPRHKRIGFALRSYVTNNSLGNAEVIRYLTDTALSVADATGNRTIRKYTTWTRSAFQLMELTKVVKSMVRIDGPDTGMQAKRMDNSVESVIARYLMQYCAVSSVEHSKVNSEVLALDFVTQYCLDVSEEMLLKHNLKLIALDKHDIDAYGSQEILFILEHNDSRYGRFALFFSTGSSLGVQARRQASIFHERRVNATMRDELIEAFMEACTEFFCSSFDTATNYISVQGNGDLMTMRKSDMTDIEISTLNYPSVKAEIEYALAKRRKFATMWAGNPGLGKTVTVRKLMHDMPNVPFILLAPITDPRMLEKQFQMLRNFRQCVVVLDDLEKFDVQHKASSTAKVLLQQIEGSGDNAAFKGVLISIVNNPAEVDEALKRPKRFGDRVILVEYPKVEPALVAVRKSLVQNNIGELLNYPEAMHNYVEKMVNEKFSFADIDSCTDRVTMLVDCARMSRGESPITESEYVAILDDAVSEMLNSREVASMSVKDGVLVAADKTTTQKREASKLRQ